MSEAPDVKVTQSDTYKEIHVTGQVANMNYDGLKLTVLHESPDLTGMLAHDRLKMSKLVISRQIECTLNLSPQNLKAWALALKNELDRYGRLFGTIMSPEEVDQKFRESN